MPHQALDHQKVSALFEQVRCEAMPESMRGKIFFNMRGMYACLLTNFTHGTHTQVCTFSASPFEEIMLRLEHFVILAQGREQQGRKGNLSLFEAFAFLDVNLPVRRERLWQAGIRLLSMSVSLTLTHSETLAPVE